ncbi:MAG: DNA topoisomerase IB [Proteobacteria bacterium]|nr:DNA topoisomerase IB [Pseudomonadota bacterium]
MTLRASTSFDPTVSAAQEAARAARSAGLIYVADAMPGIRRERQGKQFQYFMPDGGLIEDPALLARIAGLAIPPAYEQVWICRDEHGHLQATGRDARGRKQYRYHSRWRGVRDDAKFERMVSFAAGLPRLRRKLAQDLARPGLPREKVLAVLVSILDATRVRVGNAEYARDNKSFGLTTLLNRHVSFIRDGRARLNFRGKGGVQHEITIDDRHIARIVKRCQELPGQQLFQYITDEGRRAPIDSGQVNDYLREGLGDDFTAKDFRTWGATLQAVILLARTPVPEAASERAFRIEIGNVVKQVAAELRNTPAVCRKSYINPLVFDAWRSGLIRRAFSGGLKLAAPRKTESRVLEFLRRHG